MTTETEQLSATEEHERRYHKYDGKRYRTWHRGPMMGGPIWAIGWLFTIGYLRLPFFWKGVLAVVIWPYYMGLSLTRLPH